MNYISKNFMWKVWKLESIYGALKMATEMVKLQICVLEGIRNSSKAYVWSQVSSFTQINSIYDMSKNL